MQTWITDFVMGVLLMKNILNIFNSIKKIFHIKLPTLNQ